MSNNKYISIVIYDQVEVWAIYILILRRSCIVLIAPKSQVWDLHGPHSSFFFCIGSASMISFTCDSLGQLTWFVFLETAFGLNFTIFYLHRSLYLIRFLKHKFIFTLRAKKKRKKERSKKKKNFLVTTSCGRVCYLCFTEWWNHSIDNTTLARKLQKRKSWTTWGRKPVTI